MGLTESEGPILVREEVGERHIKPCTGAASKKTSPAATKVMVGNMSLSGTLPDSQSHSEPGGQTTQWAPSIDACVPGELPLRPGLSWLQHT